MRPRLSKDRVDFFEHLRRLSFHIERFVVCDRAGQKYQITEDCGAAIPFTRIDSFDIQDPFFLFFSGEQSGRPPVALLLFRNCISGPVAISAVFFHATSCAVDTCNRRARR
jgi:hypothetical protein